MADVDTILSVPSLMLCIVSLVCNAYIYQSASTLQSYMRKESNLSNDLVITTLILWLSVIDSMQLVFYGLNFVPTVFSLSFFNSAACTVVGLCIQFFSVLASLWHILIVSEFCHLLLLGTTSHNGTCTSLCSCNTLWPNCCSRWFDPKLYLAKKSVFQRVTFVLIAVTFLSTLIPLISPFDAYGKFYNYYDASGDAHDPQCWLTGPFRLEYYGLVVAVFVMHVLVLIFTFIRHIQSSYFTSAYKYLIWQLLPWIAIYSVVKVFAALERVWGITGVGGIPLWIVAAHHYSLASTGIANALVWCFNRRFQSAFRYSMYKQSLIDKDNHDQELIDNMDFDDDIDVSFDSDEETEMTSRNKGKKKVKYGETQMSSMRSLNTSDLMAMKQSNGASSVVSDYDQNQAITFGNTLDTTGFDNEDASLQAGNTQHTLTPFAPSNTDGNQ